MPKEFVIPKHIKTLIFTIIFGLFLCVSLTTMCIFIANETDETIRDLLDNDRYFTFYYALSTIVNTYCLYRVVTGFINYGKEVNELRKVERENEKE